MLRTITKPGETVATVSQPRYDGRAEITMWGLLEWAYRREMVRFAGRSAWYDQGGGFMPISQSGAVCAALRDGIAGRGAATINGRPSAHPDADFVESLVLQWLDGTPDYWLLINAAEKGIFPDTNPARATLKVRPVVGKNGAVRMYLDPVSRRPTACLIYVTGETDAEYRSRVAEARLRWLDLVTIAMTLRDRLLEHDLLTRWRVTGLGIEEAPWESKPAEAC